MSIKIHGKSVAAAATANNWSGSGIIYMNINDGNITYHGNPTSYVIAIASWIED